MNAARHIAMLERRLAYLSEQRSNPPLAVAELEALRWALPLVRPVAAREAPRQALTDPCPMCRAPGGFTCAHLPLRT